MDPKQSGIFQLGQRIGFTETDSLQANMLYRCNGIAFICSSIISSCLFEECLNAIVNMSRYSIIASESCRGAVVKCVDS